MSVYGIHFSSLLFFWLSQGSELLKGLFTRTRHGSNHHETLKISFIIYYSYYISLLIIPFLTIQKYIKIISRYKTHIFQQIHSQSTVGKWACQKLKRKSSVFRLLFLSSLTISQPSAVLVLPFVSLVRKRSYLLVHLTYKNITLIWIACRS